MTAYIVRRLFAALFVLLLMSFVVFRLVRWLPGDALLVKLGEAGRIPPDKMEAARKEMGIDRPFMVQYASWLSRAIRGDLGRSLIWDEGVATRLRKGVPITLELAILSSAVAITIALPIGILSAVKQDTLLDYIARVVAITGLAVPSFWLATVALLYLTLWFGWTPPLRYTPFFDDPITNLKTFILPSLILGFSLGASLTRMTRSTVLEVLRNDYVRTARAKGLQDRIVIARHVLKNALIPVVTIFGLQVTNLLGGSVIMESLFSFPGIGGVTLQAVSQRDYTQIQGNVLFLGTIALMMNVLVDISYAWLDPRIRYA
jgi:peptide/nickel transport system permease protein